MQLALGKSSWDHSHISSKAYRAQRVKQPERGGTAPPHLLAHRLASGGSVREQKHCSSGLGMLQVRQSFPQLLILSPWFFRERF